MLLPPMTAQLARRIEQNDIDYSLSRLDGMRLAAGNPLNIEIQCYGSAIAFAIKAWPDFWYGNKVLGLEPDSAELLDEIAAFFGERGLAFRFEIMPGMVDSRLASRLHKLGFCQMGFNTAVYGQPSLTNAAVPDGHIHVRGVRPDEMDLFLDLYQDGFGLPRLDSAGRGVVRSWLDRAGSHLYLCIAQVEDTPAGVGLLYLKDGIGLLADATTLLEYRGKGCHAALIDHRIVQAVARGCDLLTSFVEFGSASHRNLEKAGLRVAYTKAMWWQAEQ